LENQENSSVSWTICESCKGLGKKSRKLSKKALLGYQLACDEFEKTNKKGTAPIKPKAEQLSCSNCSGSGLISSENYPIPDYENYPHVAIIGAGIGGVAIAVACLHRGIPFTLFERDNSFSDRSQGYGLTLQQASKAIKGFGIISLKEGIVSTKHVVNNIEGKVVGEWGMRKWLSSETKTSNKKTNIHISRQSLRLALLEQLGANNKVQWGHQLLNFKEQENDGVDISFKVNDEIKNVKADILVGADGIRSSVRKLLIGEESTPLRYLDCIVILGICPLSALENIDSPLLDSATVFQTANGKERIYMMPYDSNSIMWQLSFPMSENEAKELSAKGQKFLKEEAYKRTQWHNPIPQILAATLETQISGYPVYDRELLTAELLSKGKNVTLIGDAAHPMSPFKGQGANQALLDALKLAREITKKCKPSSNWRETGIRKSVLTDFEAEMLARSATKVKDSAEAAKFLHSEMALHEGNEPRGSVVKRNQK
jgi:2-polyprenyl-6-methoxyphenol hydroxylase-like FAD-dependent oxidoreductase